MGAAGGVSVTFLDEILFCKLLSPHGSRETGAKMDAATTAKVLAALGHDGRLLVFRMLAQAGPQGLPAGEVARRAGHLQNTTSTHLSVLSHVGLISGRREGRSIIYAVTRTRFTEALEFLTEGLFEDQTADRATFSQRLLEAWNVDDDPYEDRRVHSDRNDAA